MYQPRILTLLALSSSKFSRLPSSDPKRLQQDRDTSEAAHIAAPEGGKAQHGEIAGDLRAV